MRRSRSEIQNLRAMGQRDALFLRFGYDSAASLRFVLSKVLPLPGHVLEIGTGKGRFLAEMAKHAERVTTLDVDAKQQRAAKLHVRLLINGLRKAQERSSMLFGHHDSEIPRHDERTQKMKYEHGRDLQRRAESNDGPVTLSCLHHVGNDSKERK